MLKSVSAFANGEGGTLVFGISDDNQVVGLADVESDAERISEEIKIKLAPIPAVNLEFKEVEGKKLVLLHVYKGTSPPYYYIGDKLRLAFARVGNESVVADRLQLKSLVMQGACRSFDATPSPYKFEDMAFSKLKSVHFKRLNQPLDDRDFVLWGVVDNDGKLTNAGALLADDSPIRHSRIFCTCWNGLDMTSGLGEALDDAELEGSVIGQLQDAVAFVRNNSHRRWWKEDDYREELPDYPERAVTEVICNAIIHRDYMELGSEIHIDMYDDRMEVYSPGGMFDERLIQQLDPIDTLDDYDYQRLSISKTTSKETFHATYENAMMEINVLKKKFGYSPLFGNKKDDSFKSSIGQIYQTFGGMDLYPSVEEKAAMLLYLVTKNHSFSDGNKRIAATLFLWFMNFFVKPNEQGQARLNSAMARKSARKRTTTAFSTVRMVPNTSRRSTTHG